MGFLSSLFKGVGDLVGNGFRSIDDLAHLDFKGVDDEVHQTRDIVEENKALSTVVKPVLNYFTAGLGSTVLDASYNHSKTGSYGVKFGDVLGSLATNQLVNYGADALGGGALPSNSIENVAQNTAIGAGKGAASAAIQGDDIGKGAEGGALVSGFKSGGNYAGDSLSDSPGVNSADSPFWTGPEQSIGKTMGDDSTAGGGSNPFMDYFSGLLGSNSKGQSTVAGNTGGDLASGLLGIYQGVQQKRKANQMQNSLSSLYAPNSPYAQQMEQQLQRQDAASGRRSQYGTRATQLAAALTQGQASTMAQQGQFANQGNAGLGSILQNIIRLGNNGGQQSLLNRGIGGLGGLFGGGSSPQFGVGASNANIGLDGMENYT